MKINDLLLRLTKEKYLNRWIIFLIDLFLSVFSTVTSLALVSYILDWNYTDQIILTVFLASLFCSTASFLVCQTYKGIIRHSAFTETGRIAMSSSLKVATILPVLLFTTGLLSFRFPAGKCGGFLPHFFYPDDIPCFPDHALYLYGEQHCIQPERQAFHIRA